MNEHCTSNSRRKYYCYHQNKKNNYGAIQSFIGLFSIAPCTVITLNPLCILFGISSLLIFDDSFLKVIVLPSIVIVVALLALKGDSEKIGSNTEKKP